MRLNPIRLPPIHSAPQTPIMKGSNYGCFAQHAVSALAIYTVSR